MLLQPALITKTAAITTTTTSTITSTTQQQQQQHHHHHHQQQQSTNIESLSEGSDSTTEEEEQHHYLTHHPPHSTDLINTQPSIAFDNNTQHAEFGFDNHNQQHRYISHFRPILNPNSESYLANQHQLESTSQHQQHVYHIAAQHIISQEPEEPGYWVYLSTYLSYLILILLGSVSINHLTHTNTHANLIYPLLLQTCS